jgi:hypothetical protein
MILLANLVQVKTNLKQRGCDSEPDETRKLCTNGSANEQGKTEKFNAAAIQVNLMLVGDIMHKGSFW